MATRLSDWPVEELPCVRVDMSLLLIMAGQFCPGYSSSIFSQATPYFSISISSLVQALSANLLQTHVSERSRKDESERAQTRNCWALSWVLLPVSPRCGNADSKRKICPRMMLWLRTVPHELHIARLAKDCLLRELLLPCLLYFKWRSAESK